MPSYPLHYVRLFSRLACIGLRVRKVNCIGRPVFTKCLISGENQRRSGNLHHPDYISESPAPD